MIYSRRKCYVAAFTGGVDGNRFAEACFFLGGLSPPSRAAWIEIIPADASALPGCVAAFTGGVDGNLSFLMT